MRRLRILTWHVHGNYLYYLTHCPHDFYLPYAPGRDGYGGRSPSFDWGSNVRQVPAESVCDMDFDLILFQSRANWLTDQYDILSIAQRSLPRIYLEHDPPREHPTDSRHPVDDPDVLLVHVTTFNELMWDNGRCPTRVIEHGVVVPEGLRYTGDLPRAITVINNLPARGRRLGIDVFERARERLPVDLVGMGSKDIGGLGEIPPMQLASFSAPYRLFFNPIRYTSMGLAVCEAMTLGMPIVGLATTEMATVIENGVSGYVDTSLGRVIDFAAYLLSDPSEARRLGEGARRRALQRFGINRFVSDWEAAFRLVTAGAGTQAPAVAASEVGSI